MSRYHRAFTILVGIGAMAIGIWLCARGIADLSESFESSWWPKTLGHVDHSSVDIHSGAKGSSYSPDIVYSFVVKGSTYRSHDIMLGRAWNSKAAYSVVEQFPLNSSVKIAYSANDPNRALLIPGLHAPTFSLFFLGCTLIGFGSLFGAVLAFANQGENSSSGQISFPSGTPAARVLWTLMLATFGSMLATIAVLYL